MGVGASATAITFIHTRDRERSKAFYRDTLDLTFVADEPYASVFDMNGARLQIVHIGDHVAHAHPVLGWEVADIAASVVTLRERGVTMNIYEGFNQDELGIWTSPDGTSKVAFFNDPDGNGLAISSKS
ncbi:MAG: VOC family protein [Hyphomonadaceae bacterium]